MFENLYKIKENRYDSISWNKQEENEKMYEISNGKLKVMRVVLSILEINIFN